MPQRRTSGSRDGEEVLPIRIGVGVVGQAARYVRGRGSIMVGRAAGGVPLEACRPGAPWAVSRYPVRPMRAALEVL